MIQEVMATVLSVRALNDTVLQCILKPDHFIDYHAGQYLQMFREDGASFFSIANAPSGSGCYELHIRHHREEETLCRDKRLRIALPYGHCDLSRLHPTKPILFLAAGTGFAPIRAMIEQLGAQQDARAVQLYWGVHTEDDFYDKTSIPHWSQHLVHFKYIPHVTQSTHASLISRTLHDHAKDLQDWQIVMAGPFDLMYAMRDALLMAHVERESMFSDAFEFESGT